ncbi:hypothetical protein S144_24 [Shewanella sp. phage 1/44]|uniref:hypothetical protein n=1 Tax=Shewanella sp. phage 1/44 TaxID=1458862 RepID=UPI0004F7169A|nr:hypothetical protein S144_24 [Shewanella sp. phage 1/44]AHK11738.1 hypothetical protein S144_24 [Shewanella sp. phage 1/44]
MDSQQLASIEVCLQKLATRNEVRDLQHDYMNKAMDELIQSNITLSKSVDESVKTQLSFRHELQNQVDIQIVHNSDFKTSILDIKKRIGVLEVYNHQNYGAKRQSDKELAWWSNNWYKLVGLAVMFLPVINLLYEQIESVYHEPKVNTERGKTANTTDTKP